MPLSDHEVKNLLSLLRTTSLTIGIVSLGLFSNFLLTLNDVPVLARKELHELLNIQRQIGDFSVDQWIDKAAKANGIADGKWITVAVDIDKKYLISPVKVSMSAPIIHPILNDAVQDEFRSEWLKRDIGDFGNLEHFRWFWDALAMDRFLLTIGPEPWKARLADVTNSFSPELPTRDIGDVKIQLVEAESGGTYSNNRKRTLEAISSSIYSYEIYIQLDDLQETEWSTHRHEAGLRGAAVLYFNVTKEEPADVLACMLSHCSGIDPSLVRTSSFDEAFPNLAKLGPHFRTADLKDLDGILDDESRQSKGELQVFGAKVPNELVVVLGIPLLILLLLQFAAACSYILRNESTLTADRASQWSLLLNGFGFELFAVGTSFLLPVISTFLSIAFVTTSTSYRWWLWIPMGAGVLAASVTSTINLHRLRRIVQNRQRWFRERRYVSDQSKPASNNRI